MNRPTPIAASMNLHTVNDKAAAQADLEAAKAAFFAKGGKVTHVSPDQNEGTRPACATMRHRVTRGKAKVEEDFGVPEPEGDL